MSVAIDSRKQAAALAALDHVRDGMILGLGTGSTARLFVAALGEQVRAGLRVVGVATSRATEEQARQLGIPLSSLEECPRLDLTVDGADEVDLRTFNLIKGAGGALLREKLVASASAREIIVVDASKVVGALGRRYPVPVEVVRFGWHQTAAAIRGLGGQATLRQSAGLPFVTDEGHYILDCRFGPIPDPAALAARLKSLTGVVEHGLFIGLAHVVIVASEDGVREYER